VPTGNLRQRKQRRFSASRVVNGMRKRVHPRALLRGQAENSVSVVCERIDFARLVGSNDSGNVERSVHHNDQIYYVIFPVRYRWA